MKWIALLVILAIIPFATTWLRKHPRELPKVVLLLGALQFLNGLLHLVIAPVAWALWPGFVKGIELSVVDAVAVVLIFSAPARFRHAHLRWPVGLYAAVVAISAVQSATPVASVFYVWQLLRMMLLITAVAVSCRDARVPRALLLGLALGLALQAVFAFKAHLEGAVQSGGTFEHQNQLGMLSHFVVFPALGLILASRRNAILWLAPIAGIASAIFTASRATIGLAALGFALLLIMSILRRPTARKTRVAVGGLLALAIAAPLAIGALDNRFAHSTVAATDYDERAAFKRAAIMMMNDHPLIGVGANNYVVVANTQGYSAKAKVVLVSSSLSANVHNAYLLAGAEEGYPGMIAFAVMLFWPIVVALRCAWRFRRDPRGEALVGLAAALIIVAMHSFYEWVFVTWATQYMYAIAVGLIAGIAADMGYWPARKTRSRPAPRPTTDMAPVTIRSATTT